MGTLVTDIAYAETANMQWANMSAWMLTVGLIVALFAVLAGFIDFLGDRRIRDLRAVWIHAIGNAVALILAIFNAFIHSRDAYTSVVPTGLILSALTVLILLVTGMDGRGAGLSPSRRRAGGRTMKKSLLLCTLALSGLAACGPSPIDPKRQIGAHPYLPDIHQYLLPPMHVVKNVGWGDATPKAAAGLKVAAFARNLKNPRSIYVLPNGDVLVAETDGPPGPVNRPKEFVMNWIEQQAHSSVKAGNAHPAVPRHQWRWHPRDPDCVPGPSPLALRHGAGRQ